MELHEDDEERLAGDLRDAIEARCKAMNPNTPDEFEKNQLKDHALDMERYFVKAMFEAFKKAIEDG